MRRTPQWLLLTLGGCLAYFVRPTRALQPPQFAAAGSVELDLAKWIVAEGGHIHPQLTCVERGGIRGLFVSEAVSAGEVLAAVPEACVIRWVVPIRDTRQPLAIGRGLGRGAGTTPTHRAQRVLTIYMHPARAIVSALKRPRSGACPSPSCSPLV